MYLWRGRADVATRGAAAHRGRAKASLPRCRVVRERARVALGAVVELEEELASALAVRRRSHGPIGTRATTHGGPAGRWGRARVG